MSFFFFSSRRRHTRCSRDWSSDVCSSDLLNGEHAGSVERDATLHNILKLPDITRPGTALEIGKHGRVDRQPFSEAAGILPQKEVEEERQVGNSLAQRRQLYRHDL